MRMTATGLRARSNWQRQLCVYEHSLAIILAILTVMDVLLLIKRERGIEKETYFLN